MVDEVDLEAQAFSPVVVEALGNRDVEQLRTEYGDAREQNMKGTLLPHSAPGGQGGSLGFNVDQQLPVIVDPDIPGGTYVLNPGDITTKEDGTKRRGTMPAGGFDRQVVRNVADQEMRKALGQKGEVKGAAVTDKPEPIKPSRKRSAPKAAQKESVPMEYPVSEAVPTPTCIVAFDFGPPVGTMEVRYHEVFREGNRLVLAWDTRCTIATKYIPAKLDTPLIVRVGTSQTQYSVLSLGLTFTDDSTNRFYVMLLIDMRDQTDG